MRGRDGAHGNAYNNKQKRGTNAIPSIAPAPAHGTTYDAARSDLVAQVVGDDVELLLWVG